MVFFIHITILLEHSIANSGDPDQMPHFVASDLGLQSFAYVPQREGLGLYGLTYEFYQMF